MTNLGRIVMDRKQIGKNYIGLCTDTVQLSFYPVGGASWSRMTSDNCLYEWIVHNAMFSSRLFSAVPTSIDPLYFFFIFRVRFIFQPNRSHYSKQFHFIPSLFLSSNVLLIPARIAKASHSMDHPQQLT